MLQEFKSVADALLMRHYGIGISDTLLAEDDVAEDLRTGGTRPFEAVNAHAEKMTLGRSDRPLSFGELSTEPLTEEDEDRIRSELGFELRRLVSPG